MMDAQQRFLRRSYLNDNIEVFLRESNYHRSNDDAEDLVGLPIWKWDEEEGSGELS